LRGVTLCTTLSTPSEHQPLAKAFNHWLFFVFQCQFCKTVVPPHTPQQKIVTKTKQVTYPARPKVHGKRKRLPEEKKRNFCSRDGRWLECSCCDHGGVGQAIAEERLACPTCAGRFAARDAPSVVIYSQAAE
jgi:hypothetical protein